MARYRHGVIHGITGKGDLHGHAHATYNRTAPSRMPKISPIAEHIHVSGHLSATIVAGLLAHIEKQKYRGNLRRFARAIFIFLSEY